VSSDLETVGDGPVRCHDGNGRAYAILGWYPRDDGRMWPVVVPELIALGEPLPHRACATPTWYFAI
jgi:hypothetical protein